MSKNTTCSIGDCNAKAITRGWCKRHYTRWIRHGDAEHDPGIAASPEAAFAMRTERVNGCLLWVGAKTPGGYGAFRQEGTFYYAHRYAWQRANGEIPEGSMIDHACHNRACVEIAHLRLATNAQNARNRSGANSGRDLPRGVTQLKDGRGFRAQVSKNGRTHNLGVYSTPDEAARVADGFRVETFGEYAGRP